MSLLFKGRTAIVTGAGGGLGREYAIELAKRGANVLVNDFGGNLDGSRSENSSPAGQVVKHIIEGGGRAVENNMSVLQGDEIVKHAVNEFGSVDIVINNAGILRDKSFMKMTKDDWMSVIEVHLQGSFSMCHHAWPLMVQQNYGRIVNVGSGAGLYGNFGQANYSSAKMGIWGLANTLSIEGQKYNIFSNCVVPIAVSRMTEGLLPKDIHKVLDPRHVTPLVSYLCHESSSENGFCYEVGGGWYSKVRIQRSHGVKLGDLDHFASVEEIANSIQNISDFSKSTNPINPADALKYIIGSKRSTK